LGDVTFDTGPDSSPASHAVCREAGAPGRPKAPSWDDAMSEVTPAAAGSVGIHCVTVKEVMAIYRIGRCTAYEQAARYLRDGPGHGIPCMKLGHSLRFPVAWIEEHIGRRVVLDALSADDDDTLHVRSSWDRDAPTIRPRHR
jgi:hypothetical protein